VLLQRHLGEEAIAILTEPGVSPRGSHPSVERMKMDPITYPSPL